MVKKDFMRNALTHKSLEFYLNLTQWNLNWTDMISVLFGTTTTAKKKQNKTKFRNQTKRAPEKINGTITKHLHPFFISSVSFLKGDDKSVCVHVLQGLLEMISKQSNSMWPCICPLCQAWMRGDRLNMNFTVSALIRRIQVCGTNVSCSMIGKHSRKERLWHLPFHDFGLHQWTQWLLGETTLDKLAFLEGRRERNNVHWNFLME